MTTQFALDLRLARKKAGLVQSDTAHLLATDAARMSALEHGKRLPSLTEICTLSLIYGRSFESLFGEVMEAARHDLRDRLRTLPDKVRRTCGTFNRKASLDRMERRLTAEVLNHEA